MPIDINAAVAAPYRARAPLSITMPCGCEVAEQFPSLAIPDPASGAKALLGQFNAALAPINPILKIVDLCLAAVDAVKAVPQLLTNPSELLQAIEKMLTAKDFLLKLLPQISIPLMAVQFLDVLIEYLEGLDRMLASLATYQAQLAALQREISRYPSMQVVFTAGEESLDAQMESLELGMGPINKIVRALNLLMGIAGLPTIPELGDLGRDPTGARAKVAEALVDLRYVRGLIPV
jgi:hypothetical protein